MAAHLVASEALQLVDVPSYAAQLRLWAEPSSFEELQRLAGQLLKAARSAF